jgi:hypothetical protein
MMGGITGAEFARFVLVFVVTLFASLAVGIFVSTLSHHAMRASAGTFLVVVFFAGVLPALWWSHFSMFRNSTFDFLLVPSPPWLFRKAFDASYSLRTGTQAFWQSLWVICALSLAMVAIACVVLPRVWQAGEGRRWFRLPRWFAGRRGAKAGRGEKLAAVPNPFAWLASRDVSARLISWRVLVPLVGLCLVLLIASVVSSRNTAAFVVCFLTAFGLHVLLKVLMAMEAGRRISEDRQSGALELLLVTTFPVNAIIQGQHAALRRHFRRPILLLAALNGAMMFTVLLFPGPLNMHGKDLLIFCELFLGGIFLLLFDFAALSWVGMWHSTTRTGVRAALITVLKVMGIPWLLIVLLMSAQPRVDQTGIFFIFGFWITTGVIIDLVIIANARRQLSQHFRTAAAGSYRPTRLTGFS